MYVQPASELILPSQRTRATRSRDNIVQCTARTNNRRLQPYNDRAGARLSGVYTYTSGEHHDDTEHVKPVLGLCFFVSVKRAPVLKCFVCVFVWSFLLNKLVHRRTNTCRTKQHDKRAARLVPCSSLEPIPVEGPRPHRYRRRSSITLPGYEWKTRKSCRWLQDTSKRKLVDFSIFLPPPPSCFPG